MNVAAEPLTALGPAVAVGLAPLAPLMVLQPNPVDVVQVSALEAAEHDGTETADGDAALPVAFARIVLAVCVATSGSVTRPVAVNEPVTVSPAIVHPVSAQSEDAWPVSAAVIVPALKLPLESRATIVEAVFAFVASLEIVTPASPL